jgi:Ca2+-binding RTX toxin-like protein
MLLRAKVLGGRFDGEVEVITLDGRFDENGRGRFDSWESRVDGKLHYRIEPSEPLRYSPADLAAAAREGLRFSGNKFDNAFDGDVGRDNLKGGAGDDRLRGLNGDDVVFGNSGDDLLAGGNGKDRLSGSAGADGLDGGAGNDRLDGGKGGDLLIGGLGFDRLTGGAGVDRFRFTKLSDSRPAKPDEIMDFRSDLIDLSGIDARRASAKDDKFVYIGDAEFDRAGELRFEDSTLQADTNGDGRADFELVLANGVDVLHQALIL